MFIFPKVPNHPCFRIPCRDFLVLATSRFFLLVYFSLECSSFNTSSKLPLFQLHHHSLAHLIGFKRWPTARTLCPYNSGVIHPSPCWKKGRSPRPTHFTEGVPTPINEFATFSDCNQQPQRTNSFTLRFSFISSSLIQSPTVTIPFDNSHVSVGPASVSNSCILPGPYGSSSPIAAISSKRWWRKDKLGQLIPNF